MTHSDPIADMFTRIRNGLMGKKKFVRLPYSKIKEDIARTLERLGFVSTVSIEEIDTVKKDLVIKLKYVNRGESAILGIQRQSKPGRRFYSAHDSKVRGYPQHSVSILTTNKGVLTDREAKEQKAGGEVVCTVW